MIIGFTERAQNVSETYAQGVDLLQLPIHVATVRTAQREHPMVFRVQDFMRTAIVEPLTSQENPDFDATFGSRDPTDGIIRSIYILQYRVSTIPPLVAFIRDDFNTEQEECFTLRIFPVDVRDRRELFTCNEDNSGTESYFCEHTVCIEDDDGE